MKYIPVAEREIWRRRLLLFFTAMLLLCMGCATSSSTQDRAATAPRNADTAPVVTQRAPELEPQEAFQLPMRNRQNRPFIFRQDDSFTFTIVSERDSAIRMRILIADLSGTVIADETMPVQIYHRIPVDVRVPVAVEYIIPAGSDCTLSVRVRVLWQGASGELRFRLHPNRFTISAPRQEEPVPSPRRDNTFREF